MDILSDPKRIPTIGSEGIVQDREHVLMDNGNNYNGWVLRLRYIRLAVTVGEVMHRLCFFDSQGNRY